MKIGLSLELLRDFNIVHPVLISLQQSPHLLLTGASGSGKSYALKILLAQLLREKAEIIFCNFKDSADFAFLRGSSRYFVYERCAEGLQEFYEKFKKRQNSGIEFDGRMTMLVFDEFPAFILSEALKDKKNAEQFKQRVSEILMLGRSYGFCIWLVMQRPDSTFLSNGARDNFQTTISLGNLSREAKLMLYSGEDLPDSIYKVGEGICYIDGKGLREIKYPKLDEAALLKLNRYLTEIMTS